MGPPTCQYSGPSHLSVIWTLPSVSNVDPPTCQYSGPYHLSVQWTLPPVSNMDPPTCQYSEPSSTMYCKMLEFLSITSNRSYPTKKIRMTCVCHNVHASNGVELQQVHNNWRQENVDGYPHNITFTLILNLYYYSHFCNTVYHMIAVR